MRGALFAALFGLGATSAFAADTSVPLPPGLTAVWRVEGRKLDAHDSAWSVSAFSTDGSLLGISDDTGTRLYRARDGALVRMLPPPFAVGQYAFSLAISAAGAVALGRVGSVDFYPSMDAREPQRYYCAGSCGPVSAVTFSPDGRWLAFQAAHGTQEVTPGLVTVIDLRGDAEPRSLEASATRTRVSFARDGSLLAANVLRVDDAGSVGLRAWSAASWRRVRDVPGTLMPRGAVGPFALNDRVAAYQRDGGMEVRELASGAVVWAKPLAPGLDAAPSGGEIKLELVAFSGELALSYESPARRDGPGALVLRRMRDGATVAMYDVAHVNAVALSPDGSTFAYSTGAGRTLTVLARTPR
jgi:WD40 repeat protein